MRISWMLILATVFFFACRNAEKRSHSGGREIEQRSDNGFIPSSSGQAFEVLVVNDGIQKDTALQKVINQVFYTPYPALPQKEAWFTTSYVNPQNFSKLHRKHKSILFLSVIPEDKRTNALVSNDLFSQKKLQEMANTRDISIRTKWDVFAQPQLVMLITAPSREHLRKNLLKYQNRIINWFDKQETRHLKEKVYSGGTNSMLNSQMKSNTGFYLQLPKPYDEEKFMHNPEKHKKLQKTGSDFFAWYSMGTDETVQNIMIFTQPYSDSLFTKSKMQIVRNKITKAFVETSMKENTKMLIEDRYTDVPLIKNKIEINRKQVHVLRGLWRVKNDFMGGPFVLYAIPDKANDRIIYIDGFVYAAGERKKPLMKRVETIMRTFKFADSES